MSSDFSALSGFVSDILGEQVHLPSPDEVAGYDLEALRNFGTELNRIEARIEAKAEVATKNYEHAIEQLDSLKLQAKEKFGVTEVEDLESLVQSLQQKWQEGSDSLKAKLEEYASVPTEVSDEELDQYMLSGSVATPEVVQDGV